MHELDMQNTLLAILPTATVVVKNPLGDGMHFHALVIDSSFTDMSLVERHRFIMSPLRSSFKEDTIHALSLKAYTPEEARAREAVIQKFGITLSDIS